MGKAKTSICLILVLISSIMFNTISFSAAKNPSISRTKASVYVGATTKIKISNANKSVKWSSGNSKVVKITKKSGSKNCTATIKGIKKGSAVITAKVGNKKYKCVVIVKKKTTKSATVYVTSTGKKYHSRKSCPTLSRSKNISAISLSTAKSQGYGPCKVCN